jgi:bZIP-type transcription factor MBZ1
MNYSNNPDFDSFLIDNDDSTPTVFPGPSFEYDLYHQQTGIPRGALASTHSYNQTTGLHYRDGSSFIMPTETLNIPLSDLDEDFDFSTNPAMFFPEPSSATTEFISPNTLVNTPTTPIKRIYPGMHSQQAAQAKAQQAQKQEQMARQQQQIPQGQKPLPTASPTKTQQPKDPLVEESISKVLNRMRQASAVSANDEDDSPVSGVGHMSRMMKKEEDDMDDDEKLLASEEGKKLTSKERRQLRNKVSARAFRSRRKGEHIQPVFVLTDRYR